MDQIVINIFFGFFTSLLITYLVIPKIIQFAESRRLYDNPGERASHEKRIPVFGGIGIFSGIAFALLFWGIGIKDNENIQFVLSALIIIFFVGIIDDLLSLSPTRKMIGQLVAILIIVYLADFEITNMHGVWGVFELPSWISLIFTIFTVVVITNAYNLIDGIDGLAAGIGIIASVAFGFFTFMAAHYEMTILSFSLTGTLLAYLKYNFHPAKIFMGDTGSLVVGFTLAVLAIDLIKTGIISEEISYVNKGPLMAISILAVPLFDSLRVFILRLVRGKSPLYADRNHIHHALLDLGFSHKQTAIIIYIASIVMILISLLLLDININYAITILALIAYLAMSIPFIILRRRNKNNA
ncbi:MAG: undecaprenyl/decaprenyl-phosphate alpha-N-acetylglucosaminyl 1-phosphate transferase [Flavobacteriales bacterium]|nr:undecaprenyl/decaprenyl-phosphate alpha-N-acetylglucosaminyl 1-phosphate transferase [Flavobacteriales bacterium]